MITLDHLCPPSFLPSFLRLLGSLRFLLIPFCGCNVRVSSFRNLLVLIPIPIPIPPRFLVSRLYYFALLEFFSTPDSQNSIFFFLFSWLINTFLLSFHSIPLIADKRRHVLILQQRYIFTSSFLLRVQSNYPQPFLFLRHPFFFYLHRHSSPPVRPFKYSRHLKKIRLFRSFFFSHSFPSFLFITPVIPLFLYPLHYLLPSSLPSSLLTNMYPPYNDQNTTTNTDNTIDIAPSLTHSSNMSTNSNSDGMDLDSRPIEAHNARINSLEHQRQYQQQFHMMQQQGHGQQQQGQQYPPQYPFPQPPLSHLQQYQLQYQQHHNQQQLLQQQQHGSPTFNYQQSTHQQQHLHPPSPAVAGYPATECHLMTPSSGRSVETEMPSLAFSDNSNNSTSSKVMMPQGSVRAVAVPPSPSPSVSPQAADSPEGVDGDYFLTSVLNMIAPVGAAPPVPHYDYLAEFTQRQRIAKGGNGEIRRAHWASRQAVVILKSLIDTKHTPAKIAKLFDKEVCTPISAHAFLILPCTLCIQISMIR